MMDAAEFTDEVLKFFAGSFKPADTWRVEIAAAVAHMTSGQLEAGIKTLKQTMGGRKITIQTVVDICSKIGFKEQSQTVFAQLRRAPGAYIEPFRAFMRAQGLWEQYHRMPMEAQVYISRLYGELWGGSHGEAKVLDMLNESAGQQPWERLGHVFDIARNDPMLRGYPPGWFPSWSDRSLST